MNVLRAIQLIFFNTRLATLVTGVFIAYGAITIGQKYDIWKIEQRSANNMEVLVDRAKARSTTFRKIDAEVKHAQDDPSDYTFTNQ